MNIEIDTHSHTLACDHGTCSKDAGNLPYLLFSESQSGAEASVRD